MESNTKTIAKRARVGSQMLFSIMFASKKCLVITIIVLYNVLKPLDGANDLEK